MVLDKSDYFFSLDSVAMLDDPDSLRNLLQIKRYAPTQFVQLAK